MTDLIHHLPSDRITASEWREEINTDVMQSENMNGDWTFHMAQKQQIASRKERARVAQSNYRQRQIDKLKTSNNQMTTLQTAFTEVKEGLLNLNKIYGDQNIQNAQHMDIQNANSTVVGLLKIVEKANMTIDAHLEENVVRSYSKRTTSSHDIESESPTTMGSSASLEMDEVDQLQSRRSTPDRPIYSSPPRNHHPQIIDYDSLLSDTSSVGSSAPLVMYETCSQDRFDSENAESEGHPTRSQMVRQIHPQGKLFGTAPNSIDHHYSLVDVPLPHPRLEESNFNQLPRILISPRSPYRHPQEQRALKYYTETVSKIIGHSKWGPRFWQVVVPQVAWQHRSIRSAIFALCRLNEALKQRRGYTEAKNRALTYCTTAIKSLRAHPASLDVLLILSTLLWGIDLHVGEWDSACIHLDSGSRMARNSIGTTEVADEFTVSYIGALGGHWKGDKSSPDPEVVSNSPATSHNEPEGVNRRLLTAVSALELALEGIVEAIKWLSVYDGPDQNSILFNITTAKTEVEYILTRWRDRLNIVRANGYNLPPVPPPSCDNPWADANQELQKFLESKDAASLVQFEIKFGRVLPVFLFYYARSDLQMREDAVEVMEIGARLRGRL